MAGQPQSLSHIDRRLGEGRRCQWHRGGHREIDAAVGPPLDPRRDRHGDPMISKAASAVGEAASAVELRTLPRRSLELVREMMVIAPTRSMRVRVCVSMVAVRHVHVTRVRVVAPLRMLVVTRGVVVRMAVWKLRTGKQQVCCK